MYYAAKRYGHLDEHNQSGKGPEDVDSGVQYGLIRKYWILQPPQVLNVR